MAIAPELLAILACPRCKGALRATDSGDRLVCDRCRVAFPVVDDIPVMLLEEAVPWTQPPLSASRT
jgi:hypothetical protein